MTELVNVEGTELSVKEYHGKMVVSFSDICNVHKCDRKRLVKHFERKRKHFLKDVDYFEITRKELNDMVSPNSKIMGNPYMRTYLFTVSAHFRPHHRHTAPVCRYRSFCQGLSPRSGGRPHRSFCGSRSPSGW